ncbi:COG0388 Predicted amidohydrolase [Burkholderiales bacterium]
MTRVAAVQMVSTAHPEDNLARMRHWVMRAAEQGAEMVILPEYFCLMGHRDTDKLAISEPAWQGPQAPDPLSQPIQSELVRAASDAGVWLVAGTLPVQSPDPQRVLNTLQVIAPDGHWVSRYDKLHLFAFDNGEERYDEARTICPGDRPAACDTPVGRTALSVCYDIRFPEFYRALGRPTPLDLIVVSAAFTYPTGKAHWEVLLRARAIENQCWLVASAQGGVHENGRRTWGHSMVINPWGDVVASLPEGEGLVFAEIDSAQTRKVRLNLPALQHQIVSLP